MDIKKVINDIRNILNKFKEIPDRDEEDNMYIAIIEDKLDSFDNTRKQIEYLKNNDLKKELYQELVELKSDLIDVQKNL